ncbi:hypothetical protein HUW51_02460 [Adhaeribacter swui]|uniref:Glycosyltransferase family 39 protein n=1 Tax=Adhaeribacter swui TaxID=2086471 RepID=A0A7G7G3A7_9BACT|nr:DUF6056 family protein [Adhaeribacter swui]QNF31641.1 hypothetical protein HUW51_02460 [Adhaeribacter swui]
MKTAVTQKLVFSLRQTFQRFGWMNASLLVLSAALVPFLILSFYSQPFADDFWLTSLAKEKGIWQAQLEIRKTWSGRYFAMFLGSVNPLVYNSLTGYKLLPFLLILFTLAALYFLISRIIPGTSLKKKIFFALLLQVLYLGFMPAIASGYYWMSSALNYQTALICLLLLAAGLINYQQKRNFWQQTNYIIGLSFLIFAGVGCNELSMVFILEGLLTLLLVDYWRYKRVNKLLLYYLLLAFSCSLLVIFSYGNLARLQTHPNHSNLMYSFTYAVAVTVNNTSNYLTLSPILLLTVLFVPVSHKFFKNRKFLKIPHPVVTTALLYLLIFQCFFVIYWNRGMHAPIWTQNFIYFIFLIGWFANVALIVKYYQNTLENYLPQLPVYAQTLLVAACFLLIFHNKQSNVRTAYIDWLSGEAAAYDQELKSRDNFLKNSRCSLCQIKDLTHQPKSIYFRQEPEISEWENDLNARYYGKKLITIQE